MTHQDKSAVRGLVMELLDPDGGAGAGGAGRVGHGDAMRGLLEAALQDLVEAEASARIGAGRYERSPERVTRRNDGRVKELDVGLSAVDPVRRAALLVAQPQSRLCVCRLLTARRGARFWDDGRVRKGNSCTDPSGPYRPWWRRSLLLAGWRRAPRRRGQLYMQSRSRRGM